MSIFLKKSGIRHTKINVLEDLETLNDAECLQSDFNNLTWKQITHVSLEPI